MFRRPAFSEVAYKGLTEMPCVLTENGVAWKERLVCIQCATNTKVTGCKDFDIVLDFADVSKTTRNRVVVLDVL